MAKIIGIVKNGNYFIEMYEDGTKIRVTSEKEFKPDYAECIDLTITKKCDGGCKYCYMGCTKDGKHSRAVDLKNFAADIKPMQEIAINVNDMTHPELYSFLIFLLERSAISNITINQKHFENRIYTLLDWQDSSLFRGIGISYNNPNNTFVQNVKKFKNSVVHVIAGIFSQKDFEFLKNKGLKLLILGYKGTERGDEYLENNRNQIESNRTWLSENIQEVFRGFDIVSFDNSALIQLDMFGKIPKHYFDRHYMGDEGEFTFYVDLVDKTFALNSMSTEKFPLMEYPYHLNDMFQFIREKYRTEEYEE